MAKFIFLSIAIFIAVTPSLGECGPTPFVYGIGATELVFRGKIIAHPADTSNQIPVLVIKKYCGDFPNDTLLFGGESGGGAAVNLAGFKPDSEYVFRTNKEGTHYIYGCGANYLKVSGGQVKGPITKQQGQSMTLDEFEMELAKHHDDQFATGIKKWWNYLGAPIFATVLIGTIILFMSPVIQ